MAKRSVKKGGGKSPRKRTVSVSTPRRVSDFYHGCIFHGCRSVFVVSSFSITHDDLSFILAAHLPYSPGAQSPLHPTIDDRSSIQHRVGVSIGGHPRFARGCEIIACFYHISVLLPSITQLFLFSFFHAADFGSHLWWGFRICIRCWGVRGSTLENSIWCEWQIFLPLLVISFFM